MYCLRSTRSGGREAIPRDGPIWEIDDSIETVQFGYGEAMRARRFLRMTSYADNPASSTAKRRYVGLRVWREHDVHDPLLDRGGPFQPLLHVHLSLTL